jgi:hypothetical protein
MDVVDRLKQNLPVEVVIESLANKYVHLAILHELAN